MISFRAHHRSLARVLALVLLATGWGVPLAFPHQADDDLLCAVAAMGGGPADGRFDRPDSARPAEHCAVCHSLRSFRNARLTDGLTAIVLASARVPRQASVPRQAGAASHRLPARAPPA